MCLRQHSHKAPYGPPNKGRKVLLFSWQEVLSLYKILSGGETLKTTRLANVASAWRRLSSDVVAVTSPSYWLPTGVTSAMGGCVSRNHSRLSPTPALGLPKPSPTAALLWGVAGAPSQLHCSTPGNNSRFTMRKRRGCPD